MNKKNDKSLILRRIKNHYGFKSKEEFADFLDIKPNTLYSWYARGSFKAEILNAKCQEISASWIATGEGAMLRKDAEVKNSGDETTYLKEENARLRVENERLSCQVSELTKALVDCNRSMVNLSTKN